MKLLKIEHWFPLEWDECWVAFEIPSKKIVFGGRENYGGVDGTDAAAVLKAAAEYADVVHAPLLDVKGQKKEAKRK